MSRFISDIFGSIRALYWGEFMQRMSPRVAGAGEDASASYRVVSFDPVFCHPVSFAVLLDLG